MKNFLKLFLMCTFVIVSLCVTVNAQDAWNEDIVCLEDMEYEPIDMSDLGVLEGDLMVCISKSINGSVSASSHSISTEKIFLAERGIVTINCSYSPASASVDFGIIAPDGNFYFVNVSSGSINRSIQVKQSGNYAVAIRNNSANTIYVTGFVEY